MFFSHLALYTGLLPSANVKYSKTSQLTAEEMPQDWRRGCCAKEARVLVLP